ncbi:hypothetical protein K5X82_06135 [Halosquirtibacter xylanolyticus]|uniref:hypothetical protein n=1 Tax=Halosquirtibacter xylanolyticus TaxID=3374599 RepID=UPI003747DE18|nr:hypothetical protein K5X82_06135 [Prolixibacteraceae bacterium]
MRIVRLAFAGYAIYYSIESEQWGWLLFAALLIWQALTNTSCGCQGNSCNVPKKKEEDNTN